MAHGTSAHIIKEHARKIARFDELFDIVDDFPKKRVAVAVPHHKAVLESIKEADARNLADAILVGDEASIRRAADEAEYELDPARIIHVPKTVDAARKASQLVHDGDADILMKGHLHTDDFLRAVLNSEHGLRTKAVMSHVFIWEATDIFGRLIFVTDASMNIAPDLVTKADILLNAVHLAGMFGVECPRVAVLAAVEVVSPKMPATIEAASLSKMCARRQFSTTCKVDGPLALDNALSERAARVKGITGDVAGRADVLLVPDIEVGNALAKSFTYLTEGRMAGVVVGASAPVVLTSRADTAENKLYSMAVAVLMSAFERDLELKIGKVHF